MQLIPVRPSLWLPLRPPALPPGTPVTFTVTLSAAPAEADAYRVQISKLGIDGYVYTGHLTLSKVVNVNENITITAADVVVTPVALPAIQSVTWTANSVTVNFTKAVDVQTGALAKGTFADSTASFVDVAATETGVLSVTYQVIDGTLAVGGHVDSDSFQDHWQCLWWCSL